MDLFNKHPFIISFIFMIICWMPVIVTFYPAILSPDPTFQILQAFGIKTKYADYVVLLDENVLLTNHHPVVHTLFLGGCVKLGKLLFNYNFGLFIVSAIQILVLSGTLAYTIKYMLKNMGLSNKVGIIALLIYSLVPMFPFYAMSPVKDLLFGCFIIMYIIMLHMIISNKGLNFKLQHYILMILVMMLVILFRNNGWHVIVLSFPFLILAVKNNWKPFTIVFILVLSLSFTYSKVLLPAFKITPGSIREVLSIPFQQTARYVTYYSDELNSDEIEIIDKILGFEDLSLRYDPELSDDVKNEFNKYATNEDLKKYFGVWFKGLTKHPISYVNATINNTYGFFYPEKTSWYLYHNYYEVLEENGIDYHYVTDDEDRDNLYDYAKSFRDIPVIGLLSNIGFNTWMVFVLTGYCIYKKKYKNIVLYLPALILILVCVAGPANTYFRYSLPYIFGMPLMISFALEKES